MKIKNILLTSAIVSCSFSLGAQEIVRTDAYVWKGDSILQGEFCAYAPSEHEIISSYHAQPHYFMPVEHVWKLKNDISSYPKLKTSNTLHAAIFNMGLDEMINAVEPDTTLRTGKEWAGVWTRDVSYSIILSMAYMQPEASMISLKKKVNANGRIIQDTGSGGAWPISSDRMIWAVAAYEVYKVTGDKEWLNFIYPVIRDSFEDDFKTTHNKLTGLVKGETSFIDWREQSYPKWMQTADIYNSESLNTSIVHAEGLRILSKIADEMGDFNAAEKYRKASEEIASAINNHFWMSDKGYYGMYTYGRENMILNPRAETLGESLAIIFDIADPERAKTISQNNPTTPYGTAIFYPQISDMPSYHNNALWPFVASYWTLACAKAGNEQATLQGIGSVFRPAALFATNKENFNLDNGDIATELNSSNMLWSLSGNIAITCRILFGINYEADGLSFSPFVPKTLSDTRTLSNFKYRNATLNITVEGYGNRIKHFSLNGKEQKPFIPADISGENDIHIIMDCEDIPAMRVNNVPNLKAPLTPIAWIENDCLCWNPIEYIGHYEVLLNGKRIAKTNQTSYKLTSEGEWQVIGVSNEGVESFASEPRSNAESFIIQPSNEKTSMKSEEISYQPTQPIAGFMGEGFVEIDHTTDAINIPIKMKKAGEYAIYIRYANGNGPVNTENKCAIRTISVDGEKIGIAVMPHRGIANWNDWGMTNALKANLSAGKHILTIDYRPENENMNLSTNHAIIDCIKLVKIR